MNIYKAIVVLPLEQYEDLKNKAHLLSQAAATFHTAAVTTLTNDYFNLLCGYPSVFHGKFKTSDEEARALAKKAADDILKRAGIID